MSGQLENFSIRKTGLVWGFALLGILASAFLVVGKAQAQSLGFSVSSTVAPGAGPGDVSVLVMDDDTQKPLADASVNLADSLSSDSGAQRHLTGTEGSSLFKAALAHAQTLTVTKEGYTSVSVIGVQSAQVTVFLKAIVRTAAEAMASPEPTNDSTANDPAIASGLLTGWPNSTSDDVVNAGLVFRSLSAFDLLHFDSESLISPLKDTIDVFGSRQIPSNLVLPEQDIFLLLGSITLNKPTYRLPITRSRATHLAGVQGTIAVKDLVSLAQGGGKLSLELVNKLKFTRAGLSPEFTPETADFHLDVNANLALRPQHRVNVSAPPFKADVLVAAATDMNGDRTVLMPTDIKLAISSSDPGQIKPVSLNAPEGTVGQAHDVLTIAMSEKARRLSGIMNDQAGASVTPGAFLGVEELADSATVPESITLRPMATGLSAAVYESANSALWYVYSLPSAGTSSVPSRRLPGLEKATAFSVIQLDFGQSFDERAMDGRNVMRKLQRFARATGKVVKPQSR